MVIRDVGRVLGLAYGFVDSISKMIPFDPSRPQNLTQCIAGEPRLQKLINDDPRVKKLTDLSLKLEGLNRNVATHAAGVVIADKNSLKLFLYTKIIQQIYCYHLLNSICTQQKMQV